MADIDSSLPIFSRATSDPVIVSKDTSANATSNPIFTQLSDGTSAVGITGGSLDVNISNASIVVTATDLDIRDLTSASDSVEVLQATASNLNATVVATDLDIRDLSASTDEVAIGDGTNQLDLVVIDSAFGTTPTAMPVAAKYEATPTTYADGDAVPLLVDENGRLQVDVVSGGGTATQEVDDDSITAGSTQDSVVNLNYGYNGAEWERVNTDGSGNMSVDIAAQSLTAVAISADNTANTETNPIFVQVVSGALSGIEVIDYDTASSVASDATSNHDYTVTAATTAKVQCCFGSASSEQKVEIQSGPLASLTTKAVQFTSMANPNWFVDFKGLLEVPDTSTGTIRIIRTNRDNQSQDLYSTIIATEV